MRVLDSSSIIDAWHNYPKDQFPLLWKWMAEQMGKKELAIPQVVMDEVEKKPPECQEWLKKSNIYVLKVDNEIYVEAGQIKKAAGIDEDSSKRKGVSDNDLLIIATAKVYKCALISDEARQHEAPKVAANKKIPKVCCEAGVSCMNLVEFIKDSGEVFG